MKHLAILVLLYLCSVGAQANAAQRIALVVGNSNYNSVDSLDNPVSDASLVADRLEEIGFDVTLIADASLDDLKQGVAGFGRQLRAAGKDSTGLFYYAGHGVQSFGTNYLLPVDVNLTDAADLDLVAVEAGSILRQMFSARNNTNIVILDACRNNPFRDIPQFGDNGLAEMSAPTGTFLAYATSPGGVALDGLDGNSPFTSALAEEMLTPGVPVEQIFKSVRNKVLAETDGQQTPWDTSSLTSQFSFVPAVEEDPELLAERKMWESVKDTGDMLQLMLFLRAYPDGNYQSEARNLLAKIVIDEGKESAASTEQSSAAEPAGVVEPESRESELIDKAQKTGEIADYQAYIAEYPTGVFAELALSEIATIRDQQGSQKPAAAAEAEQQTEVAMTSQEPATITTGTEQTITFTSPLTVGSEQIVGRSIEELLAGSPLYPPVEGLPESYWAEETCSSCHQWTQEALCTQAQIYISANAERSLAKQHPYGGTFKKNLSAWAEGGCQ